MTATEAMEKALDYFRVNPDSEGQIADASFCEREGFGTGEDPQELPPVLQYIAKNGIIILQYDGLEPTGVAEFISLKKALKFNADDLETNEDLSESPFKVIMDNEKRIFRDVRRFATDKTIVYHHGIAMCRKEKGYGTLLLHEILEQAQGGTIACFIDAAKKIEDNGLELVPNELSYLLHFKFGFNLVGVVYPPVYDDELYFYVFIRPAKPLVFSTEEVRINLLEGNPKEVLEEVRRLTLLGYFGVSYNMETHEMAFLRSAVGAKSPQLSKKELVGASK